MAQLNPEDSKVPAYSPVASAECNNIKSKELEYIDPKVDCRTHGPSQVPLVDRELQKSQARETIRTWADALNDIVDEKKCTKCTVENISAFLTGLVQDLRVAKQDEGWSKENKKALKAEVKSLLKPVKRDMKSLWKEN